MNLRFYKVVKIILIVFIKKISKVEQNSLSFKRKEKRKKAIKRQTIKTNIFFIPVCIFFFVSLVLYRLLFTF